MRDGVGKHVKFRDKREEKYQIHGGAVSVKYLQVLLYCCLCRSLQCKSLISCLVCPHILISLLHFPLNWYWISKRSMIGQYGCLGLICCKPCNRLQILQDIATNLSKLSSALCHLETLPLVFLFCFWSVVCLWCYVRWTPGRRADACGVANGESSWKERTRCVFAVHACS